MLRAPKQCAGEERSPRGIAHSLSAAVAVGTRALSPVSIPRLQTWRPVPFASKLSQLQRHLQHYYRSHTSNLQPSRKRTVAKCNHGNVRAQCPYSHVSLFSLRQLQRQLTLDLDCNQAESRKANKLTNSTNFLFSENYAKIVL